MGENEGEPRDKYWDVSHVHIRSDQALPFLATGPERPKESERGFILRRGDET